MRIALLIAITTLFSCKSNQPKVFADIEQEILQRPLVGSVGFFNENDSTINGFQHHDGSYKYFLIEEFNDSIGNGFLGPVTDKFNFNQLISFDIRDDSQWQIYNQTAFPGRLVQNSQKGVFAVSQTLFFSRKPLSINIYTIRNTDLKKRILNPQFTYYLNDSLDLQNRKGYGWRFLNENNEYWPHCSGEDVLTANIDSTIFTKVLSPIELLPNEEIELYSAVFIKENLETIKNSVRPKPWMCFPKEELVKNTLQSWNKLSE